VAIGLALLFHREALRQLRRPRFWVFGLFLVASGALLLGEKENQAVFTISVEGLETGAQMALRATTVLLAVSGFAGAVGVSEMAALLERIGLQGLGFALGVAVNMLPTIQETNLNAFNALRLRGGFRRQRPSALRRLILTIIVNSLRHGDQIAAAAQARAFSPDRSRPFPLRWSPTDLVIVGTLAALAVVLAR
jgi:energy-coupling factor transporter transmembrane protein EcfT